MSFCLSKQRNLAGILTICGLGESALNTVFCVCFQAAEEVRAAYGWGLVVHTLPYLGGGQVTPKGLEPTPHLSRGLGHPLSTVLWLFHIRGCALGRGHQNGFCSGGL